MNKLLFSEAVPRWFSGKESTSNTGDVGSIPGLGRSPGEGNDNPLQYSCLENSMDRGAWRAIVHGVTKSQTQLSMHACTRLYQCVHNSVLLPLRGRLDSIMHFLNILDYESSVWQAVFNYSKLQLAPLVYLSFSLLSNVPAFSCPWARTRYQTRHKVLALMQAWFPQDAA